MSELSSYEKNKGAIRLLFINNGYDMALKALDLSEKYHCHKRKDGSLEFSHQIYICSYMVQSIVKHLVHPDEVLAAAIMHDLPEDYPEKYSLDDVRNDFGYFIHSIVSPVTKWDGFEKTKEDRDVYFGNIKRNRYSILVKGVDRIHNFQTMIDAFSMEKIESYIDEVEEYFIPMLKDARYLYPNYLEAYLAIQHTLQRQIIFLQEILKLRKRIVELES